MTLDIQTLIQSFQKGNKKVVAEFYSDYKTATIFDSPDKETERNDDQFFVHLGNLDDETLIALHQYTTWHAPSYFFRRKYFGLLSNLPDEKLLILIQAKSKKAKREVFSRYENNLTKASDEVLVMMSQEGNQEALDVLIERYTTIVKRIINRLQRKFFFRGFDTNDLVQEGVLGLFKAIDDFKVERKTRFKDFSKHVIEKHIGTLILRSSNYKNKVLNESFSYHSPIGNESEITFEQLLKSETYAPEDTYVNKETLEAIWDKLTELEQSVLKLYSLGLSYEEIGFDVIKNINGITQLGSFNFKNMSYKDTMAQLEDKEFRIASQISNESYKEFLQLVKKKKKAIDNTIQRIRKKGKFYMSTYLTSKNI